MLQGIIASVGHISDMTTQMTADVEEQAYVAEDINHQFIAKFHPDELLQAINHWLLIK